MNARNLLPACTLATFLLVTLAPPPAPGAAEAPGQAAALRAADSLAGVVAREPRNGRARVRLARAQVTLGRLAAAERTYREANALGVAPVLVRYNLAALAAQQGRADSSMAWLGRAFAAGYGDFAALAADPDFAALRGTTAFDTLIAAARARAYPCAADPRFRAFDFWIGEWNVMANGAQVGTNTITRELEGCALYERWVANPLSGSWGHSVNRFNPATATWRQLWIDANGTQTEYEGVLIDDGIRFTGVVVGPGGPSSRSEMTFTRLPDGTVRQFIRSSPLDREEWTTAFDAIYVRRESAK